MCFFYKRKPCHLFLNRHEGHRLGNWSLIIILLFSMLYFYCSQSTPPWILHAYLIYFFTAIHLLLIFMAINNIEMFLALVRFTRAFLYVKIEFLPISINLWNGNFNWCLKTKQTYFEKSKDVIFNELNEMPYQARLEIYILY